MWSTMKSCVYLTHPSLPDQKSRTGGWRASHPRYSACIVPGKQEDPLQCWQGACLLIFKASFSSQYTALPATGILQKHKISQHNSPRRPWSSQTSLLLLCCQWELPIPDHLRSAQCSPRCRPPQCRAQRCVHPVKNRKYTDALFGGKVTCVWPLALGKQGNCTRWSTWRQIGLGSQLSCHGGLVLKWRP